MTEIKSEKKFYCTRIKRNCLLATKHTLKIFTFRAFLNMTHCGRSIGYCLQ